jgi:hypothetical protein|tara:strand:+ start:2485 stop:2694 length:210 start_codon:yes stop_codon:yes gene_type:complete
MSKTKNYLWDEAEDFVDSVFENLKKGLITKVEAKKEILESNVALDLVDINEFNIDDIIEYEVRLLNEVQ